MEKKYLPVLLSLLLLASASACAQNFFAARDLFNNIACNIICVIEYMIFAVCAVTAVLSGARYMSSDDPVVRTSMRKNLEYALVGLFLVLAGIPAMNALVNQTKSPFYCVSCSPDAQVFKLVAETISCNIICLTQLAAGTILVLIVVLAGLRYSISGDDPKTRHNMLDWVKNAMFGLVIIILAVPALNYLAEGTGTQFECDCTSGGGGGLMSAIYGGSGGVLSAINGGSVAPAAPAPAANAVVGIAPAPPADQKNAAVKKNVPAYFDASKSTPTDNIQSYSWDFGDGTAPETGAAVTHQYAKPGKYDATVTITDKNGKTSTDKVSVTVTPAGEIIVHDFGVIARMPEK